eukprot:SAG11_NODE_1509_length_4774_cov_5.905668_4_plen_152_part_00
MCVENFFIPHPQWQVVAPGGVAGVTQPFVTDEAAFGTWIDGHRPYAPPYASSRHSASLLAPSAFAKVQEAANTNDLLTRSEEAAAAAIVADIPPPKLAESLGAAAESEAYGTPALPLCCRCSRTLPSVHCVCCHQAWRPTRLRSKRWDAKK